MYDDRNDRELAKLARILKSMKDHAVTNNNDVREYLIANFGIRNMITNIE